MFKLIRSCDIGFVNKLLSVIEEKSSCNDESYKRVWVKLGERGINFHNTSSTKKCQLVVLGDRFVDYRFAKKDGSMTDVVSTTTSEVDVIANNIVSYFDLEDFPNV